MVKAGAEPFNSQYRLRDWTAGTALFAATAAVVLWQNAHVAVLFDLSYVLNTAARIASGQMPYRDFPLPHAPITFLTQAFIIRLTGRVFFHHVLYVALTGGLATVITWQIALTALRDRVAGAWTLALLLAFPLAFLGIYCIVPSPEYDCDCSFWILVALWALVRVEAGSHPGRKDNDAARIGHPDPMCRPGRGFLAGFLACVPIFCKQNMGVPFLAAVIGAVLLVLALKWMRRAKDRAQWSEARALFALLAGACAALIAAALILHWTAGVDNYIHWTMRFAAERRLPAFGLMLDVFRDRNLMWTLPCVAIALALLRLHNPRRLWLPHSLRSFIAQRVGPDTLWLRITAFALLAAPFVLTLSSLLIYYDDADSLGDALLALWPLFLLLGAALAVVNLIRLRRAPSLRSFLPLILLAAIIGTFMSQQLWGSTYGIWPLLVLLAAEMLVFLSAFQTNCAPALGFPTLSRKSPRKDGATSFGHSNPGTGLNGLAAAASARWFVPALAALVSATLLLCGAFYTISEERLSYAYLPDGPAQHSAFPQLAGLSTPGPYLPEIDELLRYTQANVPFDDGIILMPGEEPFYFATGRRARFPLLYFDPTIDPYSPDEIASLVHTRNIRWLIVKTDLQTKEDPTPNRAATMQLLMQEFTLAAHLRGYDVYRAKAAE